MIARLMAVALVVASAFAPAAVPAAQPDPAHSQVPPVIVLVGKLGSAPDPTGYFQVIVRDALNVPIAGTSVVIEFGACPQLAIGSQQTYPGLSVNCGIPAVAGSTDANGIARFIVMGGVANRSALEPLGPCGLVRASVGSGPPVALGQVSVAAFDQNGVNGLDQTDLGLFLNDFTLGLYRQRSDFDGDQSLTTIDLNLMVAATCGRRSNQSAPRCDGVPANNSLLRADDGDLYVAWNDCRGGGGTTTATYACLLNTGSRALVASFRAPAGVTSLIGFEAELEVVSDAGVALPDWWRFDSPAGCRQKALTVSSASLPPGCPSIEGASAGCVTVEYPTADAPINQQRIRIRGNAPGVALAAGQEYSLLGFTINNSKTSGLGACAACAAPVALVLQSLRLRQSAAPDLAVNIASSSTGAVAYWQGAPSGFAITDVPSGPTATDWLASPSPNPAQGEIAIRFGLTSASRVSLAVYDLAGRKIRVLASGALPAGEHTASWDGRGEKGEPLPGGLYFLRLVSAERVLARPVVRIR